MKIMKLTIEHLFTYASYKVGCSYKEYRDEDKRLNALLTGVSHIEGIETTYKRKIKDVVGDLISLIGSNNINDLEFKLHLRPLSDLNNDEKTKKHIAEYYQEFIYIDLALGSISNVDQIPHRAYKKLLEEHYDLFGLIENNLAININEIN